jgi:hypothetical protein
VDKNLRVVKVDYNVLMDKDKLDHITIRITHLQKWGLFLLLAALMLSSCSPAVAVPSLVPTRQIETQIPNMPTMPSVEAVPLSTPEPVAVGAQPTEIENPVQTASMLPTDPPTPTAASLQTCIPTSPDMLGPFYTPGAPMRDKVGEGYLLTGVVRSANGCQPIPGAQLDFWLAGPDGEYAADFRAVTFSGEDGSYHFESHFPPPYSGRPSHIHIVVYASGYQSLITQHYPVQGTSQAVFDLVMVPQP